MRETTTLVPFTSFGAGHEDEVRMMSQEECEIAGAPNRHERRRLQKLHRQFLQNMSTILAEERLPEPEGLGTFKDLPSLQEELFASVPKAEPSKEAS